MGTSRVSKARQVSSTGLVKTLGCSPSSPWPSEREMSETASSNLFDCRGYLSILWPRHTKWCHVLYFPGLLLLGPLLTRDWQEESHWAVGGMDTHCVLRPSQFLWSEWEVSLSGGSGALGDWLVSAVTNGSLCSENQTVLLLSKEWPVRPPTTFPSLKNVLSSQDMDQGFENLVS